MNEQRAVRQWMHATLELREWSPRQWALEASVNPTTLTRFLNNPEVTWLPSFDTITKLARAARVDLPAITRFNAQPVPGTVQVPIIKPKPGQGIMEAKEQSSESVPVRSSAPVDELVAARVTTDAFSAAGIHTGDTVTARIKDFEHLSDGDIVLVSTNEGVEVLRYTHSLLVPYTGNLKRLPRHPSDDVMLLGKVEQVQRAVF